MNWIIYTNQHRKLELPTNKSNVCRLTDLSNHGDERKDEAG